MKTLKKIETGIYPTPLHKLDNLSRQINKADIYVKRDDLTGFAFGGNKLRKLDYLVADAKEKGYTTLLTYGGVQTNHGRLTAAVAAKNNMKCVIMCYGQPPEYASGNLILDQILGAEVCFMDPTEVRKLPADQLGKGYIELKERSTKTIIERYESKGDKVYKIPIGGHTIIGAMGYMDAVKEILVQMKDMNLSFDYLISGLGSGGTFAGLWLGAKYYKAPFEIIGISVSHKGEEDIKGLVHFMNVANKELELGLDTIHVEDIKYYNDYVGPGYNIPDEETRSYMTLLAQSEGLFVDPCYTGKSFRGLVDLIEKGIIEKDSQVLYLHTGGTPGIYSKEHLDDMQASYWKEPTVLK